MTCFISHIHQLYILRKVKLEKKLKFYVITIEFHQERLIGNFENVVVTVNAAPSYYNLRPQLQTYMHGYDMIVRCIFKH